MSEVAWWQGSHGDEYTHRNHKNEIWGRRQLWEKILLLINPQSILEVGAGSGNNLFVLKELHACGRNNIAAIEPNEAARTILKKSGIDAHDGTAANPGRTADLVFTSGVLIHIPPDELLAACQGIYDAAERYIVAIEYFSHEPVSIDYRGRKLWKRDYGSFYLDNFPDLKVLGNGFAWKRTTGLDDLNWWVFLKC